LNTKWGEGGGGGRSCTPHRQAPPDFWTIIMINFQSNKKKEFHNKKKEFPNKKKEFPNKKKRI
jgi:hypothetical protein